MRRILVVALSAALLTTTAWVVHGAAAGSTPTAGATASAAANTGAPTDERALERGVRVAEPAPLASQLAAGRLATARYATNLRAAKADGYQLITRMIPNMGWHFRNPTIHGFDLHKPPGHPAPVAVVSEPGRPLQRHQPLDQALQPQLAHPSITRPGAEPAWAGRSRDQRHGIVSGAAPQVFSLAGPPLLPPRPGGARCCRSPHARPRPARSRP
jgi:hypothetical protein